MKRTAAVLACLMVTACTYGGHYTRSGPCEGWHTDSAGCVRAHEKAQAIAKVKLGQSLAEVRTIMGEPERRDLSATRERWGYLTDYEAGLLSIVVFTGGVVTEIKQGPSLE